MRGATRSRVLAGLPKQARTRTSTRSIRPWSGEQDRIVSRWCLHERTGWRGFGQGGGEYGYAADTLQIRALGGRNLLNNQPLPFRHGLSRQRGRSGIDVDPWSDDQESDNEPECRAQKKH